MRTAFLKTLEELAASDPRINLVVGDLGFSVVESFARRFPRQFLNAGVAEQNMAGLAAGMALSGKIVCIYSIANFPTLRCLEQIRNDGCYHEADLKVVSVGGGFSYGSLGMTHHALEDLAILRALPGMVVLAPGDPLEVEGATRAIVRHRGPCYLRLGKAGEPVVHPTPPDFAIGKALTVREGRDVTMISTGGMLHSCVQAWERLVSRGVEARLLSMATIKPLDSEAILQAAEETGGLGGAVAEVLAQRASRRVSFRILGVEDRFCREVGGQEHLRRINGLTVENVTAVALEVLKSTERAESHVQE
jgi:transketolase